MAYCKVESNDGYTIVSNVLLRDERLSLKAKGLLSLILSLPPKWDMTIEGLSKICIECSDTISGILKELEAAGYLSRYRESSENPPKYYIFFKANDSKVMNAAFSEYTRRSAELEDKPSVREKLKTIGEDVKAKTQERTREKSKTREAEL